MNSNESPSLDELPDTVYVPLGRRGMESITFKICPDCNHNDLFLIQKTIQQEAPNEDFPHVKKELVDYHVRCHGCGNQFIIRLTRLYFKDELIQTFVSIITRKGGPELWLGNLF